MTRLSPSVTIDREQLLLAAALPSAVELKLWLHLAAEQTEPTGESLVAVEALAERMRVSLLELHEALGRLLAADLVDFEPGHATGSVRLRARLLCARTLPPPDGLPTQPYVNSS